MFQTSHEKTDHDFHLLHSKLRNCV